MTMGDIETAQMKHLILRKHIFQELT